MLNQTTVTPEDLTEIKSIYQKREELFIKLCENKIDEQTWHKHEDELVDSLRNIIEQCVTAY